MSRSRHGSMYVATLAIVGVVSLTALAASVVARRQLEASSRRADVREAQSLASSAVELALARLADGPSTGPGSTRVLGGQPGGVAGQIRGRPVRFDLIDEADGDPGDDPRDPVVIRGTGEAGDARWIERGLAIDDAGRPLEPLRCPLHVSDDLRIEPNGEPEIVGGPISVDGTLRLAGSVEGDAEVRAVTGSGDVAGTLDVGVLRKGVAARSVFDLWISIGTELGFGGDLDGELLTPGVNTYLPASGVNAHGVYVIRTGGADLAVRDTRIFGTLIVDLGEGGRLTLEEPNHLEPARIDAPVLLVIGTLRLAQEDGSLQETTISLNPPGAPFGGVSDFDLIDSFPSSVNGLVHVLGRLEIRGDGQYRGAILVDGGASVDDAPRLEHDARLLRIPPLGYGDDTRIGNMRLLPGSLRRDIGP